MENVTDIKCVVHSAVEQIAILLSIIHRLTADTMRKINNLMYLWCKAFISSSVPSNAHAKSWNAAQASLAVSSEMSRQTFRNSWIDTVRKSGGPGWYEASCNAIEGFCQLRTQWLAAVVGFFTIDEAARQASMTADRLTVDLKMRCVASFANLGHNGQQWLWSASFATSTNFHWSYNTYLELVQ